VSGTLPCRNDTQCRPRFGDIWRCRRHVADMSPTCGAKLKSSIENHGKSIVRAAQIDARQRNSEQLRGAVLTLDAEKRALEKEKRPLESEKRGIRIQKALVKENPELVTIYDEQIKEIDSQIALIDSQIADVASKIDFHSSLLCDATTDAQETPMRSNKTPRRIWNSPSEERGYSTS